MTPQNSRDDKPLRISPEAFRKRQAGEPAIILDVRGQKDWENSDSQIVGAVRPGHALSIDPSWPKDGLILTY